MKTDLENKIPEDNQDHFAPDSSFIIKNRALVFDSFIKNERLFYCFISQFYPLNKKLIENYGDKFFTESLYNNKILPYTLSELIEKFDVDNSYWNYSVNSKMQWSIDLIEKYQDCHDWKDRMSRNKYLPWSVDLIERYEDKWNWELLSKNESLPWSADLIDKYKDKWDWGLLTSNNSLPWSIDLIERYENKWSWVVLSSDKTLAWSLTFIEKYKEKWDWKKLSSNESLPWSIELIEKYEKDFKDVIKCPSFEYKGLYERPLNYRQEQYCAWDLGLLSGNKSVPWCLELLQKYENQWYLFKIKDYEPTIRDGFIETRYNALNGEEWDWKKLSENETIPWSIYLIEKYKDKWHWDLLIKNNALPWSMELIEHYEHKWGTFFEVGNDVITHFKHVSDKFKERWHIHHYKCKNTESNFCKMIESKGKDYWSWNNLSKDDKTPWSFTLIEKYKDYWNWEILCENESLPWSIEFIEKYDDYLISNWHYLMNNKSLPWSIDFINKYAESFTSTYDLERWGEKKIWDILKWYVDDELIEDVIAKLETIVKNHKDDCEDDCEDDWSYSSYGGYNGCSDNAIDDAFEGDPMNTWNVD
jgi:hypothetical protein